MQAAHDTRDAHLKPSVDFGLQFPLELPVEGAVGARLLPEVEARREVLLLANVVDQHVPSPENMFVVINVKKFKILL